MNDSQLAPEVRLRIEAATEEYEMELRRELDLSKKKTHALIEKRKGSFRERLLEAELADLSRSDEEIHEEEDRVVNINLWASLAVTASLLAVVLLAGDSVESASQTIGQFMARNLSWFYVLIGGGSVVFLLYLAFGRFGSVVLGDPKGRPEFTTVSWYAMLLSTGIGAGLMFWGAAEPLQHSTSSTFPSCRSRSIPSTVVTSSGWAAGRCSISPGSLPGRRSSGCSLLGSRAAAPSAS